MLADQRAVLVVAELGSEGHGHALTTQRDSHVGG